MTHEHYRAAFPTDDEIAPGTGLKRCRYNTAAGRRCRLISVDELGFCASHRSYDEDLVAMELYFTPEEMRTAVGLSRFVSKLAQITSASRIPARNAVALAYMAQLLAQLLEPAKAEIIALHGPAAYEKLVASAIAKDPSLTPLLTGPDVSPPAEPPREAQLPSPTLPGDPDGKLQTAYPFDSPISGPAPEVGWLSHVPPEVRG